MRGLAGQVFVAALGAVLVGGVWPPASFAASPPNIVVIYLDDVAKHDGRLWSNATLTPTLYDRFVAHGVEFTHAIGENPLCCPARANLLTGLHTHNNGVVTNDARLFDPSMHVGQALKNAGYATMFIGKYLNQDNLLSDAQWVDHGRGWTALDVISGVNGAFNNYDLHTKEGLLHFGTYHSTRMVAERFVSRSRAVPASQPIFAVLSIYNMHEPNTPMPEFASDPRCNSTSMPPWNPPNYNEADVSDKPAWVQDNPLLPYPNGWPMVGYCREALGIDWATSLVVNELKAQGRYDNTLLVLTADNGMNWGQHRFGQTKNNPYSTPVPLYMSWPAQWADQPRNITEYTTNIDLAPTFCALGGCTVGPFRTGQAGPDGVSLLPLLNGSATNLGRDALLETQVVPTQIRNWWALRTTRLSSLGLWHYVEWSNGVRELYDSSADPWELQNLASRSDKASLIAALHTRLADLKVENATTGAIKIILDALPDSPRDFSFTGGLGSFVLDDDADPTLPRTRKFVRQAGTYVVGVAHNSGWSLTGINCSPDQAVDLASGQITVKLHVTELVVCTFTEAMRRPDGSIALTSSGTYKGDNVYTTTASISQTLQRSGVAPGTYSFWVHAQNDSARADNVRVKATESGASAMTVSYWAGSTNITSSVLAGTYTTGSLPAGTYRLLRIQVVVPSGTPIGSVKSSVLSVYSVSEPSRVDVIKAVVTR